MTVGQIKWIYNIKFLAILSVILGHISNPLNSFIYMWHMPLFFILSGFFINDSISFKKYTYKYFKRLMIPFFIFATIGLIAEIMKRSLLHREQLHYIEEIYNILFLMDFNSLSNTYAFVLWFLPALFFTKIIFYVIYKYIYNIYLQLFIIGLLYLVGKNIDFYFNINASLSYLIYVFIGYWYFNVFQDKKILYLLPLVFIVLNIIWINFDLTYKFLYAIAITYTLILLVKYYEKIFTNSWIKIWGGNTMLLFIIHPYTNNIAHIVVEKLHFGDWYLKFFISLLLLQMILFVKIKFEKRGILKYV
jgi:fucose 4-O-acetylase-like acetyltransferase